MTKQEWTFGESSAGRVRMMIFPSDPIYKRVFRVLMLVIKGWCYAD